MVKIDILKRIYLFQELNDLELGKISQLCTENQVTAGQEVFFTGQKAESFFVIQQGDVKIFATTSEGDEIQITRLASGAHFGEIPFLTGDHRTATAQTLETSLLIELPYEKLRNLLGTESAIATKVYRSMAIFLAARLKATTQDLSQAKQTLLRHF